MIRDAEQETRGVGAVFSSCVLHGPSHPVGFSLIEMIIALAILSVGLVGAIRVFPVGLRASQRSEWLSRATLLAERALEPLKLKGWAELGDGETTTSEGPFTIVVAIGQPVVEGLTDPTRLKRLSARVQWTQETRTRSLMVVSYVRRPSS